MKLRSLKALSLALAAALIPVSALAEEEGHKAGLPQLDVSTFPSQLFWLAVTFAILFIFFRVKTLPEIGGVLEKRQGHIQGSVTEAEQLRRQAEEAKKTYESVLEQGRAESTRLITEAGNAAKDRAARRLWEFKERSAQEIAATEKRLTHAASQAMQDMDTLTAGIASDAATKIAGIKADPAQARSVIAALTGRKVAV